MAILTHLIAPHRKQKEESARLLCLLIGASTSLIKPYAPPMLSVLLKTASAKDSSPAVTSYCLACLGELARVGGEEIAPSVDRIMALIMEMLADQTSTLKRDAALRALGQVASNTGMVIEPYHKYPQLLGLLIRFLKTEKNQTIRRETIRTMGILGALDPYKHRVSIQQPKPSLSALIPVHRCCTTQQRIPMPTSQAQR